MLYWCTYPDDRYCTCCNVCDLHYYSCLMKPDHQKHTVAYVLHVQTPTAVYTVLSILLIKNWERERETQSQQDQITVCSWKEPYQGYFNNNNCITKGVSRYVQEVNRIKNNTLYWQNNDCLITMINTGFFFAAYTTACIVYKLVTVHVVHTPTYSSVYRVTHCYSRSTLYLKDMYIALFDKRFTKSRICHLVKLRIYLWEMNNIWVISRFCWWNEEFVGWV